MMNLVVYIIDTSRLNKSFILYFDFINQYRYRLFSKLYKLNLQFYNYFRISMTANKPLSPSLINVHDVPYQLYCWETIPENSKLFDFYPILSPWFWQQWTSYLRWYFNIKTNSGKQWSKLWKWNGFSII
jgi:hypothetical protein